MSNKEYGSVPDAIEGFQETANFTTMKMILQDRSFIPTYIVGETGTGKTLLVRQACHVLKKKLFIVPITKETDEEALIASIRLKDGSTYVEYGPVVRAMQEGAVLLLDELDTATPAIMCLQSVLADRQVFIKKSNELIKAKDGFKIVATGNTRGTGSVDGRYYGVNILNSAFLDRFPCTLEHDMDIHEVREMLKKAYPEYEECMEEDDEAETHCKNLAKWYSHIKDSFEEDSGDINDIVSPRKLVDIVRMLPIFGDIKECIEYALNKFEPETKRSLINFYDLIEERSRKEKDDEKIRGDSNSISVLDKDRDDIENDFSGIGNSITNDLQNHMAKLIHTPIYNVHNNSFYDQYLSSWDKSKGDDKSVEFKVTADEIDKMKEEALKQDMSIVASRQFSKNHRDIGYWWGHQNVTSTSNKEPEHED